MADLGFNSGEEKDEGADRIPIPRTLKRFVANNLQTWIENAYFARFIKDDDQYIVGDAESQKEGEIVIMDKLTGVEQNSSKWSKGLHQFLQLKHNGKLSDENLKAVFMSNMSYFTSYDLLFGMSGTVGGAKEQQILRDTYDVDFFELPRFRPYLFELDIDTCSVAATEAEWLQNIISNIHENMDQQKTYSQEDKTNLAQALKQLQKTQESTEDGLRKVQAKKERLKEKETTIEAEVKAFSQLADLAAESLAQDSARAANREELLRRCGELPAGTGEEVHNAVKAFEELCKDQQMSKDKVRDLQLPRQKNLRKAQLEDLGENLKALLEKEHLANASLQSMAKDIAAFTEGLETAEKKGKMQCKRAVLVICDNVEATKRIEERIRQEFAQPSEYGIYRYDRAYRPFEKARLDAGDIVVATNIAGRGTDLNVSKQVERNGGLHVIMAFMPSNDRVRKQGLGRSARAGNKGTGTYIISSPGNADKTVDEIMRELDEQEYQRLLTIEGEQFPKIKAEDKLFGKFVRLREGLEGELHGDDGHKKLQISSLQNKWAMWLNEHEQLFNAAHKPGSVDKIEGAFEEFADLLKTKCGEGRFGLIDEPGELNKLGKHFLDSGKTSEASECFQHIIQEHLPFSEVALYYQGIAIIDKDGGIKGKRKAKDVLKKARAALSDIRSRMLSRIQILRRVATLCGFVRPPFLLDLVCP